MSGRGFRSVRTNDNPRASKGASKREESEMKRLFVGGLSWDTGDEGLRKAFEAYGEVSDARVITERDTGRSRGFGFVTMVEDTAAEEAKAEMNGASLDGRRIRVDDAVERPNNRRGRRQGGGGRGH